MEPIDVRGVSYRLDQDERAKLRKQYIHFGIKRKENGEYIDEKTRDEIIVRENEIIDKKTGRVLISKKENVVNELRELFTESSSKPLEIYNEQGKGYFSKSWLIFDATRKIMEGRNLKQQLGDISTDFFLEKFTDDKYAEYFRGFYEPLLVLLQEYVADHPPLSIPHDICIFYKGGNLFRILLSSFVTYLDNEKFASLMKNRSDADFQIFVNPDNKTPEEYNKILHDVSLRVIYVLYRYRENLSNSLLIAHNVDEIADRYAKKIEEKGISLVGDKVRIGKSYRSDFLMNTFIRYGEIEEVKVAYTEENSLINKNGIYNVDKNKIKDPSLYVSRNITSDFETFSGNRYLFELIRLKRNIRIEVLIEGHARPLVLQVPSELIDVSIPREGDTSLESMKNKINNYIQLYTYSPIELPFYGVTLDYLIYDLSDILFYKFNWPWMDPKYEKRFTRYFICILLSAVRDCYENKRIPCDIRHTMNVLQFDVHIFLKMVKQERRSLSRQSLSRERSGSRSRSRSREIDLNISNKTLSELYKNYKDISNRIDEESMDKFMEYSGKLAEWLDTLEKMAKRIIEKTSDNDSELRQLYEALFMQRRVNILGGNKKR